ncbi:FecR domain-containing protein [Colwellia sp. 1_MG-2023]|uniref:FecR family protein n=1 Tax=Colwellia sp. 1_MG-2023 TaxID=3062649 RepID=UPI0026E1F50B|nr:FecR domain-containing protein [Colwellia sp. 1_MG-2023]MDO6446968.1 FecR domain-containing protein [Colwellia sp. 1_MG-2023]
MAIKPHKFRTQNITTEACEWIAKLETGDLSPQDRAAYKEWMSRSPAHCQAIKKMAQLSSDINIIANMADSLEESVLSIKPQKMLVKSTPFFTYPSFAVVAFAMIVSFSYLYDFYKDVTKYPYLITTNVGGFKETMLSDGSKIKLNTNSQVEVDYNADKRKIRLIKGEAFFDVSHNPKRPFIVMAKNKIVRAVGTAFGVRLKEKSLEVLVSDGRVELKEVARLAQELTSSQIKDADNTKLPDLTPIDASSLVFLDAGQSISLSEENNKANINLKTEREIVRELSWHEGLLDFSNTPLPEVIAEVTRYTPLKIEIVDAELNELAFGGIIPTGRTEALFEALSFSFNIEIEYVNNTLVRLHNKKS